MFGVSLFMCGFVCLVKSQSQYQQFQSYPYGTSYASIYDKQPIVLTPTSSYNQVYTVQSPSLYPEAPSGANQLQEIYLNKILSNPAIQAFIDPGTKIYNQNGVEISDQVRPKTPNVVNNYFIVPTDYLKMNESRAHLKSKRYKNHNNYYNSYPKKDLKNDEVKDTRDFKSKVSQLEQRPKGRRNYQNNCQQYREKEVDQDLSITNKKPRDSFKREDQMSTKQHTEKPPKKRNNTNSGYERLVKKNRNQKDRRSKESIIGFESDLNKCDDVFDISEECCELDKRNPRNPDNVALNKKSHAKSTKNQNDFMNNWMNYVKMFMPEQNNDALDFSRINVPYNFEQMYQMPNFNNIKPQINRSEKKIKKRKQKEQPVSEILDKRSQTTQGENKIVELSPKFIEVEENKEPIKINKVTNSIPEVPTEISKKETNQQNQLTINSELSVEEVPIICQNEIIDYYPDFKNDAIYTTDEDDLYFFHNRHYYNTEDALNRERRKFDRDEDNFKHAIKIRGNDIPSYKKSNTKQKMEATQFQTPPGLIDPGFQTKKINVKDKASFYSYYIKDKDSTDFIPVEKDDNSIETVFARSKVVKYGKPSNVENAKTRLEQENRNEIHRNPYPKDGDTTVVFSKPWNS